MKNIHHLCAGIAAICGPVALAQPSPPSPPRTGLPAQQLGCPELARPARKPKRNANTGPTIAFTNVELIAMTGEPPRSGVNVLVNDGRIDRVGRNARASRGATVIDGRGMWLIPGLVDSHMHLTNIRSIDEALLQIALANGVTSEVELGGSGQPNPAERLRIRDDVAAGRFLGPALYVSSPKINDPDLTRAGGAQLVDDYHRQGYDLIKVYNRLSLEGYRGVLLRAQQVGMPVVGHVVRSVGLEGTFGSGQRGIVHMEEYQTYFGFRVSETATDPTPLLDPSVIPYLVERTVQARVWVTPTLGTFASILDQVEDLDAVLAKPASAYIPSPLFQGDWPRGVNPYVRNFSTSEHRRNLRAAIAFQAQLTRAFSDAGVPLLAGTDAPVPGVAPGFGLHDELERLGSAGLTPAQALTAATCRAALYVNRRDFGIVAPGARADLILLSRNPLENISNTRSIVGVMVRGRWLDRATLDRLLMTNRRGN